MSAVLLTKSKLKENNSNVMPVRHVSQEITAENHLMTIVDVYSIVTGELFVRVLGGTFT